MIRALTLRHPWAWCVRDLGKDVENRTWAAPKSMIGQHIAIHGGAIPKGAARDDAMADLKWISSLLNSGRLKDFNTPAERQAIKQRLISTFGGEKYPTLTFSLEPAITPGIVGVARLVQCVNMDEFSGSSNPWAVGPWLWELGEFVRFDEAVPCKGAQGLWEIPRDALLEVRARYRLAREANGLD